MSASAVPRSPFEAEWARIQRGELRVDGKPTVRPVFISEKHRMFATVDPFSKFMDHFVIAPADALAPADGRASFYQLPRSERQMLHYIADIIGEITLDMHGVESERRELPLLKSPVEHIEGNGIQNHPHIVMFAAHRKEGGRLYGSEPSDEALPYGPKPNEAGKIIMTDEQLDATQQAFVEAIDVEKVEAGLDAHMEIAHRL